MSTPQEFGQSVVGTGPDGSGGIDLNTLDDLIKAISRKRTEKECLYELDTLILQLNGFVDSLRLGLKREPKGAKLGTALIELACSMRRYLLTVEHRMRTMEERMNDWEALIITGKKDPRATFEELVKYATEHKLELVPTDEDLGLK